MRGPHWGTSVPQTSCTGRPPTFCTRFTPLVSLLTSRQTNSSSSSGTFANCWCEVSYRPDALHVTQPTVSRYRRETDRLCPLNSLTAIFPGGPGLAVRECLDNILDLLELRMMEVVVTTGAIIRAGLQSPPTNQHPAFFTGRMPFLSPNQQCQSTKRK